MGFFRINRKWELTRFFKLITFPTYIIEIWEFECNIGLNDSMPATPEMAGIMCILMELNKEIGELKGRG